MVNLKRLTLPNKIQLKSKWWIEWNWMRSLVKFVGFSKDCDQNGDRMSKNDESCLFALGD